MTVSNPGIAGLDSSKDYLPTGAIRANMPRNLVNIATLAASTSGGLVLVAIQLAAGDVISKIAFESGTIPLASGSNQWFSLYDSALNKLGVTSDDTSTAWAANSVKQLNLASPVTITSSGLYYAGMVIVASTVPNTMGITTPVTGLTPALCATSTAGLTNPASAPNPAGALTARGVCPYVYVS